MERDQQTFQYRYQHQSYPTLPTLAPRRVMLEVKDGESFSFSPLHMELGIRRVLLVHGTFVGDDPFGISDVLQSISEAIPLFASQVKRMAEAIRERTRPLVNGLAKDIGNYSSEFVDQFQQLVGSGTTVELLEPTWSSQNDHLARADLAVRLAHSLITRTAIGNDRVLLWGHSHAGNGFALLSNLLANERKFVEKFFEAAGEQLGDHWSIVHRALADAPSPHPVAKQVMVAAFGTPVRYGWDMSGLRSLVHVLFDRQSPSTLQHETQMHPLFPPYSLSDFLSARYGDWVQAFAVAGTDLSAPASIAANGKMHALLEASLILQLQQSRDLPLDVIQPARLRDLCVIWKTGTRSHTDGINLLVDYKPSGMMKFGMPLEQCVFGHGVATTTPWLPAHLKLVTETLLSLA